MDCALCASHDLANEVLLEITPGVPRIQPAHAQSTYHLTVILVELRPYFVLRSQSQVRVAIPSAARERGECQGDEGLAWPCRKVMKELGTGRSRGFGFVSYEDRVSAATAIKKMQGYKILGKRLKVEFKKGEGDNGKGEAEKIDLIEEKSSGDDERLIGYLRAISAKSVVQSLKESEKAAEAEEEGQPLDDFGLGLGRLADVTSVNPGAACKAPRSGRRRLHHNGQWPDFTSCYRPSC
eukprot:s6502_g8.t4